MCIVFLIRFYMLVHSQEKRETAEGSSTKASVAEASEKKARMRTYKHIFS